MKCLPFSKDFNDVFLIAYIEKIWKSFFTQRCSGYWWTLRIDYNGMLHHSFGEAVIFVSFTPELYLMSCLQLCKPEVLGIPIKALHSRREHSISTIKENIVKKLFTTDDNKWKILALPFCACSHFSPLLNLN